MAQTATTAARKTITMPAGLRNKKPAAIIDGATKAAPKTRTRTRATASPSNIWVEALVNAEGFHRDALVLELAVGISFFAEKGDADKATLPVKKELREVYEKAGYACQHQTQEDYKTVNRRINVTAEFYAFLGGRDTVTDWLDGEPASKQIEMIKDKLAKYKFTGINSVQALMGKATSVKRPRKLAATTTGEGQGGEENTESQKLTGAEVDAAMKLTQDTLAKANRRAGDRLPPGRIFEAGPVRVGVPLEATYDDVMSLVEKLTTFAKTQLPVMATAH